MLLPNRNPKILLKLLSQWHLQLLRACCSRGPKSSAPPHPRKCAPNVTGPERRMVRSWGTQIALGKDSANAMMSSFSRRLQKKLEEVLVKIMTMLADSKSPSSSPTKPSPQGSGSESNKTSFMGHMEGLCKSKMTVTEDYVRHSGIICTIGRASRTVETLVKMMESGMSIGRLNFAYGTHEYHAESLVNMRAAAKQYREKIGTDFPFGIGLDTQGPTIRTGTLEGGPETEVTVKKGETFIVTTDASLRDKGNANRIYVDYEHIVKDVQPGFHFFMNKGLIQLEVTSVEGSQVVCKVIVGGNLGSIQDVNLPGVAIALPPITDKDKKDITFALKHNVDMIFASFIRDANAVIAMRELLGEKGKHIYVIAKIENQQGVQNLDEIIKVADGVMVARADLGLELPIQKVVLAQKCIIAKANRAGKPSICAAQMLESMTHKPRPTRAESSDIANAILDGADCVMLAGETARGDYPVECVTTMAKICMQADKAVWRNQLFSDLGSQAQTPLPAAETIAIAAVEASAKTLAPAIIIITHTGRSAHLVSKFRPRCPIIAVIMTPEGSRQAHLYRGIMPVLYPRKMGADWLKYIHEAVEYGVEHGKKKGFIKKGDPVVVITGWKKGSGVNMMRVVNVP